jgi:threonine synthase
MIMSIETAVSHKRVHEGIRQDASYDCLVCKENFTADGVEAHKEGPHKNLNQYGLMQIHTEVNGLMQSAFEEDLRALHTGDYRGIANSKTLRHMSGLDLDRLITFADYGRYAEGDVPVTESEVIRRALGVKKVYIRDEGMNPTGSMKDYMIAAAVTIGEASGYKKYTAVSSGNHAVSLSRYMVLVNGSAKVFLPAKSTKLPLLKSLPSVDAHGIGDGTGSACYEEVYDEFSTYSTEHPEYFNANPSNEFIYDLIQQAAIDTALKLHKKEMPTHFLAGVGNGSYIGMAGKGFKELEKAGIIEKAPKIVPVGMIGAFPLEKALKGEKNILWQYNFGADEATIDAAEGSIAIASYSMPHAVHAVRRTNGSSINDLTNDDLCAAYQLLGADKQLLAQGSIPEPTGIMSLAAALKHKDEFGPTDILMLSFTGHASKDLSELYHLLGVEAEGMVASARINREDLIGKGV